jgi:hypothetical protein
MVKTEFTHDFNARFPENGIRSPQLTNYGSVSNIFNDRVMTFKFADELPTAPPHKKWAEFGSNNFVALLPQNSNRPICSNSEPDPPATNESDLQSEKQNSRSTSIYAGIIRGFKSDPWHGYSGIRSFQGTRRRNKWKWLTTIIMCTAL